VLWLDDEPALHIEKLLRDGWFDTRELTTEDTARPARYREQVARADFSRGFDTLADYLHGLQIGVHLDPVGEPHVTRVSQLTLRTNQFNLAGRRLQPPQVRALTEDPYGLAVAIHTTDRFGDSGLVGAILARLAAGVLHIEDFVLSCRVFARGIEQACLAALLEHARATGARAVHGTYRRTGRNGIVADFYPRHGFGLVGDDGSTATFRHDLTDISPAPAYIRLTGRLAGRPAAAAARPSARS
jgi:FkbH-like protein